MPEQCSQDGLAEPSALMAQGDASFVDPHLGRLVWVHVVHTRDKTNDLPAINGDSQMVPRIAQELGCKVRIHGVVEDAERYRAEEGLIV